MMTPMRVKNEEGEFNKTPITISNEGREGDGIAFNEPMIPCDFSEYYFEYIAQNYL